MQENITVVIVNYNGGRFITVSLEAVLNQSVKAEEIIIVDNNSDDDSLEIIRQVCPQAVLMENKENRYFAAGANQGIKNANGEYILLLNNDCVLEENYLAECLAPMQQVEDICAVTGKIFRIDGKTIDTAGQLLARSRKPLDRGYGKIDDGKYDEAGFIFSAGGVAPLLRRSALEAIKEGDEYFDESFVQYYEDLDLFWRANNLGWRCFYNPAAGAKHYRGATGQSEPATQSWLQKFAFANLPESLQKHLIKNRYAVMAKNDQLFPFMVHLPWILAYEIKLFTYMLLVKPSLFQNYLEAFNFLKTAFRKRNNLIKKIKRQK